MLPGGSRGDAVSTLTCAASDACSQEDEVSLVSDGGDDDDDVTQATTR